MAAAERPSSPTPPDIASAAFKSNPETVCGHLRRERPVVRASVHGTEAYLVTRHQDAAAVFRDERFVKDPTLAASGRRPHWMPRALKPLNRNLLDLDGQDHRRLRSLVQDTF